MTAPFAQSRPARHLIAIVAVCAGLLLGCTTRSDAEEEPVSALNPILSQIVYASDVLEVGGVALRQFPDYEPEEKLFGRPQGWPVLRHATLMSSVQPFELPTVTAVLFSQNEPVVAAPQVALAQAEASIGLGDAPIALEGADAGPDRTCTYRVRVGPVGGPGGDAQSAIDTVIAAGTARPSAGVVVHGYPDPSFDVEGMTKDIAAALCAPSPF